MGPEEMKLPQKQLYTYNVRDGDGFIVDEKAATLLKPKKSGGRRLYASCSPRLYDHFSPQKNSVSMAVICPASLVGGGQNRTAADNTDKGREGSSPGKKAADEDDAGRVQAAPPDSSSS